MTCLSDDDTYMDNEEDLEKHLVSEVGTIWRGTSRQPRPLLWEYGQVRTNTRTQNLESEQNIASKYSNTVS